MGTTLADVIPTTTTKPLAKTQRKTLFEHRRDIEGLGRYVYRENDLLKTANTKLVSTGAEMLMNGSALPKAMSPSFDLVRGRSTVRSARELADQIGFAILPWVLVDGAYCPPTQIADPLRVWLDIGYAIYIMAPVNAYALEKHVKKQEYDRLPVFVPTDARQAFMALGMSIPVFRSMQSQIDSLRDRMNDYYDRLRSIEHDVKQLGARVSALGAEVGAARVHKTSAEGARAEALTRWYSSVSDPLALILPQGKTIENLDTSLLVGPAWGGDLPAELVRLVAGKNATKLLRAQTK